MTVAPWENDKFFPLIEAYRDGKGLWCMWNFDCVCVKNACMAFFPRYLQPKSVLLERLLLPGLDTAVYHKPHFLVYLYVLLYAITLSPCSSIHNKDVSSGNL